MFLSMLVAWLIPNVPRSLKERMKHEKVLLMDLLLTEEAEKQQHHSQRRANIDIIIKSPEEEETAGPECSMVLQSQSAEGLNELQNSDKETKLELVEEEPVATITDPEDGSPTETPRSPQSPSKPHITSDSHLKQSSSSNQSKAEAAFYSQESNMDGPPHRDQSSKPRSRCRTLPPRNRGYEPGDSPSKASHSTSYVQLSQKIPPSTSELLRSIPRMPSQSVSRNDPSSTHISVLPRPPSKQEITSSQMTMARSPSKPEFTSNQSTAMSQPPSTQETTSSQGVVRSPSKPEFTGSQSTVLPRPPSKPELSSSQSTALPRPPSKPELMGSIAKGLPLQDPSTRAKSRCQTLPPRQRGPDSVESLPRASHSTSFTNLNQKVPPSPSDLTRNTPV